MAQRHRLYIARDNAGLSQGELAERMTQIYTRVPDAAKRKAAGAARLVPAA